MSRGDRRGAGRRGAGRRGQDGHDGRGRGRGSGQGRGRRVASRTTATRNLNTAPSTYRLSVDDRQRVIDLERQRQEDLQVNIFYFNNVMKRFILNLQCTPYYDERSCNEH